MVMLMSFLKCNPNIFVINDEYEILIFLKEKGICFIEVAGQYFYEENMVFSRKIGGIYLFYYFCTKLLRLCYFVEL